jgi:ribA/ribD-fused uncharacterized protein
MSVSVNELRRFYKMRAKKPDNYTYDDAGNLVEKNNEGSVIKTYPLPTYRKPTYEELDEMAQSRLTRISEAEEAYEDARRELRQLMELPSTPVSEIVKLNRKISDLDNNLQAVRFPLRTVIDIGTVEVREVMFDDIYETRKLPSSLKSLITRPYNLQDQYVRIGQEALPVVKSVAELKEKDDKLIQVVLFSEPPTNEYDFMGLKWDVVLEYNDVQYNSAYQALMAEVAKAFNDNDNLQRIMIADSPDDIDYTLENVPGDLEVNEGKWNTVMSQLLEPINIQKFRQYPELAEKLLQTRLAKLGYYIPDDNLLGIGLAIENPDAKKPSKWTGQNLLGKALEKVRNTISRERIVAKAAAAAPSVGETPLPQPKKKKPVMAPQ